MTGKKSKQDKITGMKHVGKRHGEVSLIEKAAGEMRDQSIVFRAPWLGHWRTCPVRDFFV
jgi:hypothetical protein